MGLELHRFAIECTKHNDDIFPFHVFGVFCGQRLEREFEEWNVTGRTMGGQTSIEKGKDP